MSPELRAQLNILIEQDSRSQNRVAVASDIDPGQLSRALRGEKSLSVEALEALAQALGGRLAIMTGRATGVSTQAETLPPKHLQALTRFANALALVPEDDKNLQEDLEYSIHTLERAVERQRIRAAV